jgi:hypothetical protein
MVNVNKWQYDKVMGKVKVGSIDYPFTLYLTLPRVTAHIGVSSLQTPIDASNVYQCTANTGN